MPTRAARSGSGRGQVRRAFLTLFAVGALATLCVAGCTAQTNTISLLSSTGESDAGATNATGGGGADGSSGGEMSADTGGAGGAESGGTTGSGGRPTLDSGLCRSDAECSGAAPFCDRYSGSCVQCLTDAPCLPLRCDFGLHVCTGCLQDADCRTTTTTPYCDIDDRRCVQCVTTAQCSLGTSCNSHQCTVSCKTDDDCVGSGRQFCAVTAGVCNECVRDSDCPSDKPRCNLRTGSCVCYTDADCPGGYCRPDDHVCAN